MARDLGSARLVVDPVPRGAQTLRDRAINGTQVPRLNPNMPDIWEVDSTPRDVDLQ